MYCCIQGALAGLVCSTVLTLWLGVGAVVNGTPLQTKPFYTFGCPNDTTTMITTPAILTMTTPSSVSG